MALGSPFNLSNGAEGRVHLFDNPGDVLLRHYKTDWWGERMPAWCSWTAATLLWRLISAASSRFDSVGSYSSSSASMIAGSDPPSRRGVTYLAAFTVLISGLRIRQDYRIYRIIRINM